MPCWCNCDPYLTVSREQAGHSVVSAIPCHAFTERLSAHDRTHRIQLDLLRQIAELVDATVFENKVRLDHQVAHHFRNEGFTGAGLRRNPRRDVSRYTAEFVSFKMNLAKMDAATQRYAERRDAVGDRSCAADSMRRSVEDTDKAVSTVPGFTSAKLPDLAAYRIIMPIE